MQQLILYRTCKRRTKQIKYTSHIIIHIHIQGFPYWTMGGGGSPHLSKIWSENCFWLWKRFESSKSLLIRFPSRSEKICPSIIVLYNCIVLCNCIMLNKNLWPFSWMGFNCLKARATSVVYFLPLSSQKYLVLILSTSEG